MGITQSNHFALEELTDGVYACIHKHGGAAYANAGIVDLGDRTIVVDAFNALVAGRDLRRAAEALFDRPVDTIVLTHPHSDHWIGASAFDPSTTLLAHKTTRKITRKWGMGILKDYQDPTTWEDFLKEEEEKLQSEKDERVRVGLEISIARTRYVLAEMADFLPRYADQTFDDSVSFEGSKRAAEFRSMGRGHSEDDAVLLLPEDGVAFIGDIGFFDTQPFFGFCDIDRYRKQAHFFLESEFPILVPGHGPVGDKNDIALQLEYFDVMEDLIGSVVRNGGSLEEALQIRVPDPFDKWLYGGMGRFEVNVNYLFEHFGGEQ